MQGSQQQEFIEALNPDGLNVLHIAILQDQFEMVQFCIEDLKLDVSLSTENRLTCLDLAKSAKVSQEMLDLLKKNAPMEAIVVSS